MVEPIDGTKAAPHGMFYMEDAGGYRPEPEHLAEAHQPSCFALEEERGWNWKGTGATGPTINEAHPTL